MKRSRYLIVFLGVLAALLTACNKKNGPTPEDTILGSGYSERPDFVRMDEAYAASLKEEGLIIRDTQQNHSDIAANSKEHALVSVYFKFDNFSLSESERSKLVEANRKLSEDPSARLLIVGHCSYHGTAAYNMALGEKRAKSVEDYLITTGVQANRLYTLSRGDLDASARTGTPEETAQDRRADLVVVP